MPLFGSVATNGRGKATTPSAAGTPTVSSYQNGQVPVSWTAPSFTGGAPLTNYVLQYSSNGGTNWSTWSHAAGWATSATVTGLSNGTTYIFRVYAVNAVGQGAASNNSAGAVPATVPSAPGTPTISITTSGRIDVTWSAPASNGGAALSDYALQWSSNGGANWNTWSHGAAWATAANVTGLSDYSSYVVRVAAVNAAGQGSWSATSASKALRNDATGGTVSDVSNYNGTGQTWRIHRFDSSGTLTITSAPHVFSALAVGGAGGGTGGSGGGTSQANTAAGRGGNGGSVWQTTSFYPSVGALNVVVGAAGANGGIYGTGGAGTASGFPTGNVSGGASVSGWSSSAYALGGAGAGGSQSGGTGGAGVASNITGSTIYYGAGGGGGNGTYMGWDVAPGGSGVGGSGGSWYVAPTAGTTPGSAGGGGIGGGGGSQNGVCIFSYRIA